MTQRKGALTMIEVIVLLLILLIFALVFMAAVLPKIQSALGSETIKCDWSLFLHAFSKVGGVAAIPPECKAHRFTITKNDLERLVPDARKAINMYHEQPEKYAVSGVGVDVLQTFKPDGGEWEWALDKLVADELKSCSDKVIKGKLPLFSEWWSLLDCKDEKAAGGYRKCTPDDWSAASTITAIVLPGIGIMGLIGEMAGDTVRFAKAPTFCVLCSRIVIDPEVPPLIGKNTVTSLRAWMAINPVRSTNEPYYKYVDEWQTPTDSALFKPKYTFDLDTPLAVMYERVNVFKAKGVLDWGLRAAGFIGEPDQPTNTLKVLPYTPEAIIGTPETAGECQWILD